MRYVFNCNQLYSDDDRFFMNTYSGLKFFPFGFLHFSIINRYVVNDKEF